MATVTIEFSVPDTMTLTERELFDYIQYAVCNDWYEGDSDNDLDCTWIRKDGDVPCI